MKFFVLKTFSLRVVFKNRHQSNDKNLIVRLRSGENFDKKADEHVLVSICRGVFINKYIESSHSNVDATNHDKVPIKY